MSRIVAGGATDVTEYFQLRNVADGTDATGKTITAFDLQYVRSGALPAAKVDATALAAAGDAHADNKMIEVDVTDQPALYRVDWPDAAFAAGVAGVVLTVKHADIQTSSKYVQIDAPVGPVGSLATQAKADVNAEVVDVMTVDTHVEPAQGTPPNAPTKLNMMNQVYRKIVKDKVIATSTLESTKMADGTTTRHKRTLSDDGTTTTKAAAVSGP